MRISTSMLNDMAVNGILQDESALSITENQLSTGLSINTPADNPVGAVQLLQLNNTNTQYQQYISNGQSANANLTLEQTALSSSTTTLQSIRDLVVQANSATNNTSDLQSIATQIQQLEQQLLGTANGQNAQGQYLFAGYSVGTQPFVRGSSGSVSYVGDSGASSVPLDGGTSVQTGDPGSSVYMNIPSGNGTFTTAASTSNTGTGVIDAGSVTDASQWTPDPYTISFSSPTQYTVTDETTGDVVVPDGTYDSSTGGNITFNGVEIGLSGAPAAGDTFTVAPSSTQSIFNTLDSLVSSLNNAGSGAASRAQLSSSLAESLQQIDQALSQVSTVTTNVGSRISLIGSVNNSLTSQSTTVTTEISNLDSLNYAAATSQYSQEYLALQAAEESYAQLGQLSLFKYLS
ncbi:MAG TPA: flagellar hook-associated protein FlgL [Steroidobacteraceae bacterium]|jgi:flagellar hook-associated protein 3 FlgL|nr:flagellar hook-associated protein FlgL [Steroidobacteraceae bacterium]